MDLYSDIILDYYKHPRNKGQFETAHKATEHNPSCGDIISVYLEFDQNEKVSKATYDGHGCAISQASTSMLTEELIGKSKTEIQSISNDDIFDLLGVEISAGRIKCALIGLVAAKNAL